MNADAPTLFDFNYTNGAGKDRAGLSEYGVNGGAGNSSTVCLDVLESWGMVADASMARASHPFHMHVDHLQVTEVVSGTRAGRRLRARTTPHLRLGT